MTTFNKPVQFQGEAIEAKLAVNRFGVVKLISLEKDIISSPVHFVCQTLDLTTFVETANSIYFVKGSMLQSQLKLPKNIQSMNTEALTQFSQDPDNKGLIPLFPFG